MRQKYVLVRFRLTASVLATISVFLVAILFVACGAAATPAPTGEMVAVELDFSIPVALSCLTLVASCGAPETVTPGKDDNGRQVAIAT